MGGEIGKRNPGMYGSRKALNCFLEKKMKVNYGSGITGKSSDWKRLPPP